MQIRPHGVQPVNGPYGGDGYSSKDSSTPLPISVVANQSRAGAPLPLSHFGFERGCGIRADLCFFNGLAAAATSRRTLGGWLADQLGAPDRGDELLHAVIIEINRGSFRVRLRNDAHAVLVVPDRLPFD